jgi:hypothetical protein
MVTIGALATVVAAATGVQRTRVNVLARALRDRGAVASDGRGYGASVMSPYDAATLLMASMAADTVRQALVTLDALKKLGGVAVAKPIWAKRAVSDLEMTIGDRNAFLEVVGSVLQLSSDDRLIPSFAKQGATNATPYRPMSIAIVLFGPVPAATITVLEGRFYAGWRFGGLAKCDLRAMDDIGDFYENEVVAPRYRGGYVIKTSRVGEATVRLVAKAIGNGWSSHVEESVDE